MIFLLKPSCCRFRLTALFDIRCRAEGLSLDTLSRGPFDPLSPSTDLSNHLQSIVYYKGVFLKRKKTELYV